MTKVEFLYLVIGVGIVVHGVLTGTLSALSLGAGMFFIGLVPVTRADREELDTPAGFTRKLLIAWLTKGSGK